MHAGRDGRMTALHIPDEDEDVFAIRSGDLCGNFLRLRFCLRNVCLSAARVIKSQVRRVRAFRTMCLGSALRRHADYSVRGD